VQIPQKFELGGLTIDVVRDNTLVEKTGIIGKCVYEKLQIIIDEEATPSDFTEQSYLHELVHWILYTMNEHELRDNDKFVDVFATFLYQAMKSGGNLK
jgi:hypothetical protein